MLFQVKQQLAGSITGSSHSPDFVGLKGLHFSLGFKIVSLLHSPFNKVWLKHSRAPFTRKEEVDHVVLDLYKI